MRRGHIPWQNLYPNFRPCKMVLEFTIKDDPGFAMLTVDQRVWSTNFPAGGAARSKARYGTTAVSTPWRLLVRSDGSMFSSFGVNPFWRVLIVSRAEPSSRRILSLMHRIYVTYRLALSHLDCWSSLILELQSAVAVVEILSVIQWTRFPIIISVTQRSDALNFVIQLCARFFLVISQLER